MAVLNMADSSVDDESASSPLDLLPAAAAACTLGAILLHAPAFARFFSQWQELGAAGITGNDFWAPFQFWLFFAAMHPLLQPALWISEVLHGSPGPKVADLVPATFLLGNVVVLGALARVPQLRNALNVGIVGLFINYIGMGLEGTNGLGDYNLALDDGIAGCPTYEEVRQPTMAGFDRSKYTGRWYEHAFHDWTQFSDTYDVTLDIELSTDKVRRPLGHAGSTVAAARRCLMSQFPSFSVQAKWLDDFGLRGPAPLAAPRSWDKSPVANGAHYFLYGKFDTEQDGVLQESGFGVTFPNYIVDVQKGQDGERQCSVSLVCRSASDMLLCTREGFRR